MIRKGEPPFETRGIAFCEEHDKIADRIEKSFKKKGMRTISG